MIKLNANYSDYTDETDENYPTGKAINASSSDSYDGTPLLAEFMNDVNAAHIAMYEKAYGNRTGISGNADTQIASQFADAIAKYSDDNLTEHTDERGLADNVHGATVEATAGQLITRDDMGRAQIAPPVDDADIVCKSYVDGRTQFKMTVTADASVASVATDGIIDISASAGCKLTLGSGASTGLKVDIYNTSSVEHTVNVNGEDFPISAGKEVVLYWAGVWRAECRVPIDDVYIQYGGMKFPQELYPCTKWTNISENYKGEFFRVAGGNSASTITEYSSGSVYSKTEQTEGLPNITGEFRPTVNTSFMMKNNIIGAFKVVKSINKLYSGPGTDNLDAVDTLGFDASKSNSIYGASTHVTPQNSAIQLWQRIS